MNIFDTESVLSDEARKALGEAVVPATFSAQQFLVRAGAVNSNLYFIQQGLVRFVYSTEDGKEFNKSFAAEGGAVGCMRSLVTQQPCRFSIQALEDTTTLVLGHDERLTLFRDYPEIERLSYQFIEQLALKKEAREAEFLLDNAETRYLTFLEDYPGLVKRIPQYQIASYLGITDVALSRIRKKMKSLD